MNGSSFLQKSIIWLVLTALQVGAIALSIPLGQWLAETFELLPTWIVPKLYVTLGPGDAMRVATHFCISGFLFLGVLTAMRGHETLTTTRGAVASLYTLGAALGVGVWSLFFRAQVRIAPETFFAIGLSAIGLHLLLILLAQLWAGGFSGLAGRIWAFLKETVVAPVKRPVLGGLLLVTLSPVAAAKAFFESQQFADLATEAVMQINADAGLRYDLRDAFPGLRFQQPMYVEYVDDTGDLAYVLERRGHVYLIERTEEQWVKVLALNIADLVGPTEIENGALGFALHPNFADPRADKAGHAYLYYTDARAIHGDKQMNRIVEYDLGQPTPEARRESANVLIEFERGNDGFHNGGTLLFDSEGFLYISIGEISNSYYHQRIDQGLQGGVMRIDVDQRGGDVSVPPKRQPVNGTTQGYYIPTDNPFVDVENAMGEFWALGLRNPFRISYDPESGMIWAGDVGSADWEEVNFIEAGRNYQYPFIEGLTPTGAEIPDPLTGEAREPYYYYQHTAQLRAVIGGPIYRGSALEDMPGKLIFADNYSGQVFAISVEEVAEGRGPEPEIITRSTDVAQRGISSLILDPEGELLITTLGRGDAPTGRIWRVSPREEGRTIGGQTQAELAALDAEIAVDPANASHLWGIHCARCHGRDGKGEEEFNEIPMPNFTIPEYALIRTDEELYEIIAYGGEAYGLDSSMPPWEDILTVAEIRSMVTYLRGLPATE